MPWIAFPLALPSQRGPSMSKPTPKRGLLMRGLFLAGGLVLYVLALLVGAVFDLDSGEQPNSQERQR